MYKYAALLRGIGPTNPNMRNEKLRSVFEGLGFTNVQTVISSGNVLFESSVTDSATLEAQVERALPAQLGFNSTTIIRSMEELQRLVDTDPFKGAEHSNSSYLTVTFLKHTPPKAFVLPQPSTAKAYRIVGMQGREIFSVVNLTAAKTPDLMSWLERQLGKEITTRTWKTVNRITAKLAA